MDEIEIRKQAIFRYENGESPEQIYQSLGKSKKWFFKWLKRYKHGGKNWSEELSRRPHHSKEKIENEKRKKEQEEYYKKASLAEDLAELNKWYDDGL